MICSGPWEDSVSDGCFRGYTIDEADQKDKAVEGQGTMRASGTDQSYIIRGEEQNTGTDWADADSC